MYNTIYIGDVAEEKKWLRDAKKWLVVSDWFLLEPVSFCLLS